MHRWFGSEEYKISEIQTGKELAGPWPAPKLRRGSEGAEATKNLLKKRQKMPLSGGAKNTPAHPLHTDLRIGQRSHIKIKV